MYVCTIMYGVCLCDCEYECDCERVHVCIALCVRARNCTRGGNGVRGEGGAVKWREVRGGEKRSFCQSGIRILVFSSVFLTRSFVLCLCDISYARAHTHVPSRPSRAYIYETRAHTRAFSCTAPSSNIVQACTPTALDGTFTQRLVCARCPINADTHTNVCVMCPCVHTYEDGRAVRTCHLFARVCM